jgi:predicted DCC family thiol-disulfide oxidoreductase YuxK
MYYISQVDWFSLSSMRGLFRNPVITTVSSYCPMFYQTLFPVAILSPLKLVWIAIGMMFHLGVMTYMGLISFSTVMMGLELFLITDAEYEQLGRWTADAGRRGEAAVLRLADWLSRRLRPAVPRGTLYIDGWCPMCRSAAGRLARLDTRQALEIRSFRDAMSVTQLIPLEQLERRMHLVMADSDVAYAGFGAMRALTGMLPLLAPLAPVAWLVDAVGVGPRVYDWVAVRRRLIPIGACDAACGIPTP